ncbi:MAG: molybdopterin-dependent oxidoreductase [Myxococcota bacterium]
MSHRPSSAPSTPPTATATPEWKSTACILCECNCGIEVQLGGEDGRRFTRIRGDKKHPLSQGYACEKANRLDFYQNGRDRITAPLRRRPDGRFEEIDWDTAIREVAGKLAAIRDEHGGDKIFYYGGGGQGNHLPGGYARSTLAALGSVYRSNALAQEKTGEFWVNGKMFGSIVRGDFEHCEVGVFIGKNPWQSHSMPRARVTLKEIAKDPARKLIVIDPKRTETADLADIHLSVRPGADAWLLSALIAVIVQEGLADQTFIDEHVVNWDQVVPFFDALPVEAYASRAGVPADSVREAARVIAAASSAAFFEDLGVQMNRHSTLVSYLNRLLWIVTGSYGKKGSMGAPIPFQSLVSTERSRRDGDGPRPRGRRSPVAGARIIGGLVPCNVIAEEILTDHPDRYRAMLIESGNPAHSLADSRRFREALDALDLVVVIDVALTETARRADYVLPVPTQFEKAEATFFNFEFPENAFFLRKPLLEPVPGVLPEPEIHTRIVEALGRLPLDVVAKLREALGESRQRFTEVFFAEVASNPEHMAVVPSILYRTLGEVLPRGAESAAAVWGLAHMCALRSPEAVAAAGFEGEGTARGEALFQAILDSPTAVVYAKHGYEDSWNRIATPGGKIDAAVPELFDSLRSLATSEPARPSDEFPLFLSAGERRSFTANTIFRHPDWRKKDREGALFVHPDDALAIGLESGSRALLTTKRGRVEVQVEVTDRMRPGHVSLPNGLGLSNREQDPVGIAPNELTCCEDRDEFAGTPWHKSVPARLTAL